MRNRQILVVDESTAELETMREQFAALGMETERAGSLSEAIARLQTRTYDAVLADLWMEQGAGARLLCWMKEAGRAEPVLLMAEGADYDLMIEYINKGAVDLVARPVEAAELRRSLNLATGEQLLVM